MKREAVVAFYQATYIAKLISASKKESYSIYDNFPLWDEEEMREIKILEYKEKLNRMKERMKKERKGEE